MVEAIFGDTPDSDYPGTIEDTFISINNENNSSLEQLNTYTWPDGMVANAVIMKCDLSAIPADAIIIGAKLYLYLVDSGRDTLYTNPVHKIINHNPVISAATGYTYDGINPWNPSAQCYNNVPLAQADISPAEDIKETNTAFEYKTWNVTQMVKDWISGASPNYGMLINSDPNATLDSFRYFASSENPDPNLRPKLVIEYVIGTICATLTIIESDPCEGVICDDVCLVYDLYSSKCVDGECSTDQLIETNSSSCGYIPPKLVLTSFEFKNESGETIIEACRSKLYGTTKL